ncbi:MAG: TolC family protein [Spirochaetes bacterium]|nr:TolC family protein [Spirochaetota bacterium]
MKISGMMIIFLFLLVSSSVCSAEINSDLEKITLQKAVIFGLENNHDYKLAVSKLNQADEKVKAAWSQLMPVLESEASATRQYADTGVMSLSDGQYDFKLVQLKFAINPGVFYNSLQAAGNAYASAKADVARIKNDIEFSVIQNYFRILLSRETVELRRESVEVLKQNLKDVQSLYKTGSISKLELLQAQVQLKNQEPLLLEAENSYKTSLDVFNYTLGVKENTFIPDEGILSEKVMEVNEKYMDKDTEKLVEIAMKNRPEIIQLESKKEIAENSKSMNSSYYLWPTFSISGSYGYTKFLPNEVDLGISGPFSPDLSQISGNDEWQNTWQIRAAATYQWGALLPSDKSRADERENSEKIKEASEELVKLRHLIVISINSSYLKLCSSYITIQSQKENVAMAQEGLRIARESYRAGLIKNSELLNADLSLTTAKTGYINAINSYYIAAAELKKETGADVMSIVGKGDEK